MSTRLELEAQGFSGLGVAGGGGQSSKGVEVLKLIPNSSVLAAAGDQVAWTWWVWLGGVQTLQHLQYSGLSHCGAAGLQAGVVPKTFPVLLKSQHKCNNEHLRPSASESKLVSFHEAVFPRSWLERDYVHCGNGEER